MLHQYQIRHMLCAKWIVHNVVQHRRFMLSKNTRFLGGNSFVEEIKLMKGKAPRKQSLHEKTATSVLLKLFISSNE